MMCIFHVTISLTRAIQQIRSAAQYKDARCTCLSYLPISTHPSPELIRICFLLLILYFSAASDSSRSELSKRQYYPTSHSLSYTHTHTHTHTRKYNRRHHHFQGVQPQNFLTNTILHVSIIFYTRSILYSSTSL